MAISCKFWSNCLQLRMNENLGSTLVGNFNLVRQYVFISTKIYATDKLKNYIESYIKLGMKKEIEQLTGPLWKINQDLQENAYPEAREYGWDFQYQKDDWRRFLELQKQNPDQTHHHFMQEQHKKLETQLKSSMGSEIDSKNR
jgi:hypothetical protein